MTFISDLSNSTKVKKKKGSYFHPSALYAVCYFDISLLPIKLNLPMVYPPIEWRNARNDGENASQMSDLIGGYLSCPTLDMYDRYRLLSSVNFNHFKIFLPPNEYDLCNVMNKLQGQAFQINSDWLKYLQK